MVLRITPGPLPADGARIKIEQVMTAFVQGTDITNFGPNEFSDGPVGFVISQTEAPATDTRGRGTLWFARGVGKLYKWTPEPVRSNLWTPSESGVNQSEALWVAMSDRKEAIVKCRFGWQDNLLIRMNTAMSEWKFEISQDVQGEPRHTLVMAGTAGTDGAGGTGFGFEDMRFQTHSLHCDPVMIAENSAVESEYTVVVEAGFCRTMIEGPGANDNDHPSPLYHKGSSDPFYRLVADSATAWTTNSAIIAFCCESAASNLQQVLDIFKPASSTNMVTDDKVTRFSDG